MYSAVSGSEPDMDLRSLAIHTGYSMNQSGLSQILEEKFRKCIFPENKKTMAPPESALQELSNEWSCQKILTILNFWGIISVSRPW
jgi:DNA polymerase/3'-5' exonuclease PolX